MAKTRKLPKKIELIDESEGYVLEYDFDHAERILKLQESIGLGKLKLFNTDLYYYDHEQGVIRHNEREQVDTNSVSDHIAGAEQE